MSHATRNETESVVDTIETLSWVARVGETDRPDATHLVETELSVIRRDEEIRDIENLGAVHESTSTLGPSARVYVRIND